MGDVRAEEILKDSTTELELRSGGEKLKYAYDISAASTISLEPGTSLSFTVTLPEYVALHTTFRKWLTTLVVKYGAVIADNEPARITYDNLVDGVNKLILYRGTGSVEIAHTRSAQTMTVAYSSVPGTFSTASAVRGLHTALTWIQRGFTPFPETVGDITPKVLVPNVT